jgi:hypothetical protein
MTEVRVNERSCLDTGEAVDRRSIAAREIAIGMATAVTPIGTETAGNDPLKSMETNQNGKRRGRRTVLATTCALGYCRNHMERAAQQQAWELAQLD